MKKITKSKLQQLTTKNKTVFLADMRSPVSYRDGHVEGAVNLPLRNFINAIMGLQRDTIIVVYSDRSDDSDLTVGLNYATEMGFTNLNSATFDELK